MTIFPTTNFHPLSSKGPTVIASHAPLLWQLELVMREFCYYSSVLTTALELCWAGRQTYRLVPCSNKLFFSPIPVSFSAFFFPFSSSLFSSTFSFVFSRLVAEQHAHANIIEFCLPLVVLLPGPSEMRRKGSCSELHANLV